MTDVITQLLREAQTPIERELWSEKDRVEFTPSVCDEIFGDGRCLFKITTINNRPRFWIIRGCSSWRIGSGENDDVFEHIDEITNAIEIQFGSTNCFDVDEKGRFIDEETGEPAIDAYIEYPVINTSIGCSWARMSWPDMDDYSFVEATKDKSFNMLASQHLV